MSVVDGGDPAWFGALRQASFRGVPFAVLTGDSHFGRRQSLHEYPFRDTPWVEDLGRGTRRYNLTGFLISDSQVYGGGAVLSQRKDLMAAIEAPGSGTLVHPTLGNLTVLGTVAILERWDTARYFELQFAFVEAGAPKYPTTAADTGTTVSEVVITAKAGAATDFGIKSAPLLATGGGALGGAITAVGAWTGAIVAMGADATSLLRLASQLAGPYGRFFNAANLGLAGILPSVYAADITVGALAAQASVQRASLAATGVAETTIAANLGLPGSLPADLASAAQATTAALAATAANPGDTIRLLAGVQTAFPAPAAGIAGAIGDLHRRAAVTLMASAASAYQPASYDDAAALRAQVTSAIDAEILIAGDQADDASFAALRALRTAVVQDLTVRGASLANLVVVTSAAPTPSLVLANRLYRDAGRADQLVTEADPVHPLFMPTSFRALAA